MSKNQSNLFSSKDDWETEWQDMPEFEQKNLQPVQKIVVSFLKREDVEKFAKLVGCKLTEKTKSIWFPYKERDKPREFKYVDE